MANKPREHMIAADQRYIRHVRRRPHSRHLSVLLTFAMNLLLLMVVLLLLFGGGGFYFGGPAIGGGGVGLILLVCLIVFLMGGFRAKN